MALGQGGQEARGGGTGQVYQALVTTRFIARAGAAGSVWPGQAGVARSPVQATALRVRVRAGGRNTAGPGAAHTPQRVRAGARTVTCTWVGVSKLSLL